MTDILQTLNYIYKHFNKKKILWNAVHARKINDIEWTVIHWQFGSVFKNVINLSIWNIKQYLTLIFFNQNSQWKCTIHDTRRHKFKLRGMKTPLNNHKLKI